MNYLSSVFLVTLAGAQSVDPIYQALGQNTGFQSLVSEYNAETNTASLSALYSEITATAEAITSGGAEYMLTANLQDQSQTTETTSSSLGSSQEPEGVPSGSIINGGLTTLASNDPNIETGTALTVTEGLSSYRSDETYTSVSPTLDASGGPGQDGSNGQDGSAGTNDVRVGSTTPATAEQTSQNTGLSSYDTIEATTIISLEQGTSSDLGGLSTYAPVNETAMGTGWASSRQTLSSSGLNSTGAGISSPVVTIGSNYTEPGWGGIIPSNNAGWRGYSVAALFSAMLLLI